MKKLLLLAAASATLGGVVIAQPPEDRPAEAYLRDRVGALALSPVGEPVRAKLADDEAARVEVALDNSQVTFLIAACDDDCLRGVTLKAFGADGGLLASYMKDDGKAFIQIPAGSGSMISVEMGMISCIDDPCEAIVQPFVRKP